MNFSIHCKIERSKKVAFTRQLCGTS
jgi:hypothetical protein